MLHQTFQEQERAPVEGRQRSTPRLLLLRPAAYGSSHRCSQAGFLGVIPTIPISSALYFLYHRLNSFSLEGAHDFNNFSFYYSHQRSSNSFGLISGVLLKLKLGSLHPPCPFSPDPHQKRGIAENENILILYSWLKYFSGSLLIFR